MVKAIDTNLEGILEGKKQYRVPLYQRVYSWRKEQLQQLWDDVREIAETRRTAKDATHFIGSLVLAATPGYGPVGVQAFLVVDGQQRLTTLTLLLAAIRDHQAETEGPEHRERIDSQFLINRWDAGQPTKVLPTQADRDSYLSVIHRTAHAGQQDNVGDAYRFFRAQIAQADDPEDPRDIAEIEEAVLRGLALVSVTAEAGDNEHRIFESLNNTGLNLTQSDLLKNFLFMRLGDRTDVVYETVWLPLESKLGANNLELLFWLDLAQRDDRIKQSDTYRGQKQRLSKLESAAEIEAETVRIARLGEILAKILEPSKEPVATVRARLERIRDWGTTTSFPLVMHILARRDAGEATDEQVVRALTYLESYFVRRIIIGRATANLNRTLLQAVSAISGKPEVDIALREYLSTGRKHFGTDAQVREAVSTIAFYWQGRQPQKKLILEWLEESHGSKETVDSTNLSIEHVLPQTLSPQWRNDFAAGLPDDADPVYEHDRIVHTLGNLTLTGYNSELSNRPFDEKREMLRTSGLRMNQQIASHGQWGQAEILSRAQDLADRIISLWPGPVASGALEEDESDFTHQVAAVVAAIPAGRWTTYGEVALVVGTHAVPLAQQLATRPIPNAWRVLRAGGQVAPNFRWLEDERTDDPVDLLKEEGVDFDHDGHASEEQFVGAEELAALTGLDTGTDEQ